VATKCSLHFFDYTKLPVKCHVDEDEWKWQDRNDPVLHIELRKWADVMVIAPLDANTMAKLAAGICDNLLTCVVRAWDPSCPLVVCPAMNTFMWEHPLTSRHLDSLRILNYIIIPPISKTLACGDTGNTYSNKIHLWINSTL
jgi:phosphopantothenoylcysteine decarboxylase